MLRPAGLTLLATLAVLAAGCAASQAALPSPARSAPQVPTPTWSPSPASKYERILAAYSGYWRAYVTASRLPADQARALLEPYGTLHFVSEAVDGIGRLHANGHELVGDVDVHVTQIAVNSNDSRVRDCQDRSRAALADAATHQVIPTTTGGPARAHVEAFLKRGKDGRWRLTQISDLESTCTPPTP